MDMQKQSTNTASRAFRAIDRLLHAKSQRVHYALWREKGKLKSLIDALYQKQLKRLMSIPSKQDEYMERKRLTLDSYT